MTVPCARKGQANKFEAKYDSIISITFYLLTYCEEAAGPPWVRAISLS